MAKSIWVKNARNLIKSALGFGQSISSWEKNNKVITKIVYRYPSGQRNSVLVDIKWTANNNTKIINLVTDLSELMRERNDEFKGDKTKVLASLNQLEKKN